MPELASSFDVEIVRLRDGHLVRGESWDNATAAGAVEIRDDGTRDPAFPHGTTILSRYLPERITALVVDEQDRIIIGGTDDSLERLFGDGGADPSFGDGGSASFGVSCDATKVARDEDGMLLVLCPAGPEGMTLVLRIWP